MTTQRFFYAFWCLALAPSIALTATMGFASTTIQLKVQKAGAGAGTITSSPAGINCMTTCSANFSSGTAVKLTATAKSGSKFAKWSGACSGTATSCTVFLKTAASVTATFNLAPVQLTVHSAGTGAGTITSSPSGINCGTTCSASFAAGTSVKLTATAKAGSKFAKWSGACSGTSTCTLDLKDATSATATFTSTASPVQLTVRSAGTGAGTVTSSPSGINCASTCSATFASGTLVTLTATASTGSTFAGWSGACTGTGACAITPTANATITATFNVIPPPVQLTVQSTGTGTGTVMSNPSGINCGTICSASFASGTLVTLTATPSSGSTFAGWSGACTGTGACAITPTANATITATFNVTPPPVQLTVQSAGTGTGTVTSNPVGINCGATCSASFASGALVTLTATASTGSTFAGWSGACTGMGACAITPTANVTITATFNVGPSVQLTVQGAGTGTGTVVSNPSGINCGTICSASFASGALVTLTATPSSGSTFAGWSGACTGTGACAITPTANATITATFNVTPPPVQLTVQSAGTGTGTVTSNPSGINCGSTCSASFASGTLVTLTATPSSGSTFAGWSGACTGTGKCVITPTANASVTATFNTGSGNISVINHIVFFAQENRSLDNYFGAMRQYWAENGIPDQSFDGLPQFNPTSGEPPLYGPPPALPGCNPADPMPSDCVWDPGNLVTSYHLITVCNENTSPSWSEAHVDWDYTDQVGKYPAKNNGFVHTAAHDARTNPGSPFYDVDGIRAMGYWDGTDLNYDYFMATNFATSDRFFQPAMARTNINREYLAAATSGGYAYPNGADPADTPQLKSTTIFEELTNAGISWKVYINPEGTGCTGPVYQASCLIKTGYLENFTYAHHILLDNPQNIAPISEYFTDLANGTLPQFAEIEPASDAGLDEHGSDHDAAPENVQAGSRYVSTIINALMKSSSWNDSALIFTYDESGGMYDHVSPQPEPSPDGIPPVDLPPDSVCYSAKGPTCDFTWTGYRIPLIVVSPYAKQNYVSHTVADSTAILKFVETRFNLAPLTKRDAAQIDMTEFFDFNNPPWMSPPVPPAQNMKNPCYLNKLP